MMSQHEMEVVTKDHEKVVALHNSVKGKTVRSRHEIVVAT